MAIETIINISESLNSVPSWASSISLDCQSDETIVEFMKNFVQILYEDSTTITLDIKSEFGHKARVSIICKIQFLRK